MNYIFSCKNVELNESIKEYSRKKLSKLERYIKDENATMYVTFSVEKKTRCTVDVTIRLKNLFVRAQNTTDDGNMRALVDLSLDDLERQLRKNKTRLEKKFRSPTVFEAPAEIPSEDSAEESEYDIVRIKSITAKPMTSEEAILQMNLLKHDFYVYRDPDENVSVVYKRNNGGYGIIVVD